MSVIKAGLVGYGLAGKAFHAPLLRATPGIALTTVVSGDAAKVHADLPDVMVVPDYTALLADPAIDLVVLATPDALHAPQALAALDAGKHLVIDKPLAPTLAEARMVGERAAARDRIVAVFHNRRWDADFLTLRHLIEDGALGRVVQFESHFDRFRPTVGDAWKDRRGGGVWFDLGPHLIDQALCLFGMPLAIHADIAAQRTDATAPDYFHAMLRYPDKRAILHATALAPAHGLRFAVHGTAGSFVKHGLDTQEAQARRGGGPADPDWGLDPAPGTLTRTDGTSEAITGVRGDYPAFYAGLRDAILGRAANPVPMAEALAVMEVLDAGLRSAAEGREIAFPILTQTG